MSDIFREVEEEVRRERYAQLWKQYGDYVIAGLALLILAVAGWQVWRYYEARARLKASQEYMAAEALLESGHPEQAATAFAKLADTAPSGYATVSRLHNADALLAAGHSDEAIKLYKAVAAGDDPLLSAAARMREAWALADSEPRLQLEALLAPINDAASPWRFMAREILAYADYKAGKLAMAEKEYRTLAGETDAPIGVRQRANAMANFLKAGGDKSFGTVPPAAPQAAPPAAPAAPQPEAQKPDVKKPEIKKPAPAHPHRAAHPAHPRKGRNRR